MNYYHLKELNLYTIVMILNSAANSSFYNSLPFRQDLLQRKSGWLAGNMSSFTSSLATSVVGFLFLEIYYPGFNSQGSRLLFSYPT